MEDKRVTGKAGVQGGSNWLCAETAGHKQGKSEAEIWGPPVHHAAAPASEAVPTAGGSTTGTEGGEKSSMWTSEGGSNKLCAERTAAAESKGTGDLWGPHVRDSSLSGQQKPAQPQQQQQR